VLGWQLGEAPQHWEAELVKCGERQLRLELRPGRGDHTEPGRGSFRVPQKRALANAGLTTQNQDAALAGPCRADQLVEAPRLVLSAEQRSARGRTFATARTSSEAGTHPLTRSAQGRATEWR
jgi:hypothetical protein